MAAAYDDGVTRGSQNGDFIGFDVGERT